MTKENDVLSKAGIQRYLRNPGIRVTVYPTISSTNTVLKQMAAENAPAGTALVAAEQTAGRGRLGRSFYSPDGSGLYMSLLLRPEGTAERATMLTPCAAVAAAGALEEVTGVHPGIKWVNDLFVEGKKVCGILTEAGLDCETGRISYAVVGIGINLRKPKEGFPEEIREIAGAAVGDRTIPDLRNRIAARTLEKLTEYARDPGSDEVFEEYRSRLMMPGRTIQILSQGKAPKPALALALERDYALRVRMRDGSEQMLRTGEISIRMDDQA